MGLYQIQYAKVWFPLRKAVNVDGEDKRAEKYGNNDDDASSKPRSFSVHKIYGCLLESKPSECKCFIQACQRSA